MRAVSRVLLYTAFVGGFLSLVLGGFLATEASAANLTSVSGKVMVNSGSGYKPASNGMVVNPGDKILVGPDATAKIIYPNGAVVTVAPGEVVTVASVGPEIAGGLLEFGAAELTGAAVVAAAIAGGTLVITENKDTPASP